MNYTFANLESVYTEALTKEARVFGESEPTSYMEEDSIPYKKRKKAYKRYLGKKSKERPTKMKRALLTGGGIGAGLGGLTGAALGGSAGGLKGALGGGLGGAAFGGGLGALHGAGLQQADKHKIQEAKRILGKGKIGKHFDQRVIGLKHQRKQREAAEQAKRHSDMLDAIKGLGDKKEPKKEDLSSGRKLRMPKGRTYTPDRPPRPTGRGPAGGFNRPHPPRQKVDRSKFPLRAKVTTKKVDAGDDIPSWVTDKDAFRKAQGEVDDALAKAKKYQ